MYQRHIIGIEGESEATKYLREKGYEILDRNFRCKQGEIDIIARDKEEYVFIEVKTRKNFNYGKPIEAVNSFKQKHIYLATKYYIHINKLENNYIRFDVIEILQKERFYINHIKNCEFNIKL